MREIQGSVGVEVDVLPPETIYPAPPLGVGAAEELAAPEARQGQEANCQNDGRMDFVGLAVDFDPARRGRLSQDSSKALELFTGERAPAPLFAEALDMAARVAEVARG